MVSVGEARKKTAPALRQANVAAEASVAASGRAGPGTNGPKSNNGGGGHSRALEAAAKLFLGDDDY